MPSSSLFNVMQWRQTTLISTMSIGAAVAESLHSCAVVAMRGLQKPSLRPGPLWPRQHAAHLPPPTLRESSHRLACPRPESLAPSEQHVSRKAWPSEVTCIGSTLFTRTPPPTGQAQKEHSPPAQPLLPPRREPPDAVAAAAEGLLAASFLCASVNRNSTHQSSLTHQGTPNATLRPKNRPHVE